MLACDAHLLLEAQVTCQDCLQRTFVGPETLNTVAQALGRFHYATPWLWPLPFTQSGNPRDKRELRAAGDGTGVATPTSTGELEELGGPQ